MENEEKRNDEKQNFGIVMNDRERYQMPPSFWMTS